MEFLYGIHSVYEALKAGRRNFKEVLVKKTGTSHRLEKVLELAASKNVPIRYANVSDIATVAGTQFHQGICLETGFYPLTPLRDLLQPEKDVFPSFFLFLDSIVDPNNLGAILRTALCAGVDGVIISKNRSAGPSPSVSRVSAGALEHIRLARVTNMTNTIKTFKKKGFWIFGADADAGTSIFSTDCTGTVVLVIGGEGEGMRFLIKKNCDYLISIPMKGKIESLNATAAGAVILYEALRQRALIS